MHNFLTGADYWIERYQTLVAAGLAFIGVYFTVLPSWRQVSLLEAQRTDKIRERLAATYRMLNRAIELLSPEAWREAVQFGQRPSDDELAALDLHRDLLPAYQARLDLWRQIKTDALSALDATQVAVVADNFQLIDNRVDECSAVFEGDWAGVESPISRWFYAAEYPDQMATAQLMVASTKLSALAAQTVEALIKPGKT